MPKSTRVPQPARRQMLCTQKSGEREHRVPMRNRAWDGVTDPARQSTAHDHLLSIASSSILLPTSDARRRTPGIDAPTDQHTSGRSE